MLIDKNILWLTGGIFGKLGNAYGLVHKDGIMLFDSGHNEQTTKLILENLNRFGCGDLSITELFLTHGHFDHAGGGAFFQKNGAKVYCGKPDAERYLPHGNNNPDQSPFDQPFEPFNADVHIDGRSVFDLHGVNIIAIPAPGHTAGSYSYLATFENKRLLFTGDTLSPSGSQGQEVLLSWRGAPDYDPKAYVSSLLALSKLECDMILGGHGYPLLANTKCLLTTAAQKGFLEYR